MRISAPITPATFTPIEVIGPISRSGSSVYFSNHSWTRSPTSLGSVPITSLTRLSRECTIPGTSSTNWLV